MNYLVTTSQRISICLMRVVGVKIPHVFSLVDCLHSAPASGRDNSYLSELETNSKFS